MTIRTRPSTPSIASSPNGRPGRNIVIAAAGSVIVAAAVAGGLWARSELGGSSAPAVEIPAGVPSDSTVDWATRSTEGAYTPHTVFIVGSADQGGVVQGYLNDADAIRSALRLSPLRDEVTVAASSEEATAIVAAETAANDILATQYGVANSIEDLR